MPACCALLNGAWGTTLPRHVCKCRQQLTITILSPQHLVALAVLLEAPPRPPFTDKFPSPAHLVALAVLFEAVGAPAVAAFLVAGGPLLGIVGLNLARESLRREAK